jgi:hypothetical protein
MKWTWNGITLTQNPIVWEPSHDRSGLKKTITLDDGRVGKLSVEIPCPTVNIRCAFDKVTNEVKKFFHDIEGEFWVESDVRNDDLTTDPRNQWKVEIVTFSPSWNMKGPTGQDRRFDLAMDLVSRWPYAKDASTNGPTERANLDTWNISVGGNHETWNCLVEITGIQVSGNDSTNPKLTDLTTGKYVQYTGIVGNGQTLIINMLERSAVLAGSDVTHLISSFWPLAKGTNSLKFECSGSAKANVKLAWYPCYI